MCEEPVRDNVLCLYEVKVQPPEAPVSPFNCVLHCHPGTMMLTVIGDCVPHPTSPTLHLAHHIPLYFTSIWPHLQPPHFRAWLITNQSRSLKHPTQTERERKLRQDNEKVKELICMFNLLYSAYE